MGALPRPIPVDEFFADSGTAKPSPVPVEEFFKQTLPPPPSPREVGIQQLESAKRQASAEVSRHMPEVSVPEYGPPVLSGGDRQAQEEFQSGYESFPVVGGPRRALEGARTLFGGAEQPKLSDLVTGRKPKPAPTPTQRLGGAVRMVSGAMETLAPAALPAIGASLAAAPIATGAEIVGGTALGYGTRKGLEAVGAPQEVAEAGELAVGLGVPIMGTARRLRGMLPSRQAPPTALNLGTPRAPLALSPAPGETYGRFPMRTAPADIEIAPQVVRKQSPPTMVPPSHQLPAATTQLPAATLPEAYRATPAEQVGRREMSLDDVRNRIALLESERATNPLQKAQLDQELGELRSYLEPDQPRFPIPDEQGGSRRTTIRGRTEGGTRIVEGEAPRGEQLSLPISQADDRGQLGLPIGGPAPRQPEIGVERIPSRALSTQGTPYYRPRQGELLTGGRIDVKPESKVYGAGPEDAAAAEDRMYAQGELRRAEEASSRTLPKTPKTPPEYQPTLDKQLESIGYEVAPASKQTMSSVALMSPESATSTYPALRKLSQRITSSRVREAEISKELTTLSQSAPTSSNIARTESLNDELSYLTRPPDEMRSELRYLEQLRKEGKPTDAAHIQKLQSAVSKRVANSADEDEIVRTVERMEAELPKAELGAAQYTAKPPKARGLNRRQTVESIGESVRGPEFAPPLQPKPPTGGVSKLPGTLREPPTPKIPDRFSATPAPRETFEMPSYPAVRTGKMGDVVGKLGPAGKEIRERLYRSIDTGEAAEEAAIDAVSRAGVHPSKLTRAERINAHRVIEGKDAPLSPAAEQAANAARKSFDEVAKLVEDLPDDVMISLPGGGRVSFSRRKDFAPHYVPGWREISDTSSQMSKDIVENVAREMNTSPDDALKAYTEIGKFFQSGKKPGRTVAYLMKKESITEVEALKKLELWRKEPKRGKRFGSLEYARLADLPFYDPDIVRSTYRYLSGAHKRVAQIRELGQEGQIVNRLLDRIKQSDVEGASGQDAYELGDDLVKRIMGEKEQGWANRKAASISAFMRTWSGFALGPQTSILNLPQSTLNGLLKTDAPTVFSAVVKTLTKSKQEVAKAIESGALSQQLHLELASAEGLGGKYQRRLSNALAKYHKYNTYGSSEKLNRVIGAAQAPYLTKITERLAKSPANPQLRHELEELTLRNADDILSKGLTDADMKLATKRLSDSINFRNRNIDMIMGTETPLGRMLWQFKNYAENQARLAYDSTFGEWKRGGAALSAEGAKSVATNYKAWRNMAHLLITFPATGTVIGAGRAMYREYVMGQEGAIEKYKKSNIEPYTDLWGGKHVEPEDILKAYIQSQFQVTAFGITAAAVEAAAGFPDALYRLIGGPTVGLIVDNFRGVVKSIQKERLWDVANSAMRSMPFLRTVEPLIREDAKELLGAEPETGAGRSGGRTGRQGRGRR